MSRPTLRVLLTGAGTVTCQSFLKGARAQGDFEPFLLTVDASPEVAGRYFSDAFELVPFAQDPAFVPRLLELVQRHQIQLLVPIVDYEFEALSEARSRFAALGCTVALGPPESIRIARDKWLTAGLFRELGLGTAESWLPEATPDARELRFPLFLKPRDGRSSLDTHRVANAAELAALLPKVPRPLLQRFVVGEEFTADVLCDLRGRFVGAVPRKRLETKNGVSTKGVTVEAPDILRGCALLAERLGLVGPSNVQVFRTPEGELLWSEVNPRCAGTLALTIAAGMNVPRLLGRMVLGLPLDYTAGSYQRGLKMFRYWAETYVDAEGAQVRGPAL